VRFFSIIRLSNYDKSRKHVQSESDITLKITFCWHVSRVVINVTTFCSRYWYGLNCDVYCQPTDNDTHGHTDCDPDTGNKVCKKGTISWGIFLLLCQYQFTGVSRRHHKRMLLVCVTWTDLTHVTIPRVAF
jgi:hypothetical protein